MEIKNKSTEDKIINASFKVIEKYGFSNATTRKIADEAAVSEVTIFRKFKTKKRLLEAVKESFTQNLLDKLDEIFDYSDDISIEEYLKSAFDKCVNLSDKELNIVKIGMEEVRGITFNEDILPRIAETIIHKLNCFFKVKINNGEIREINSEILALNVFSIIFESIILWKVYGKDPYYDIEKYSDDFMDILFNGISKK